MIKNVKPEMNLAMQLLMCSVSTCENYPLFHFVSYISFFPVFRYPWSSLEVTTKDIEILGINKSFPKKFCGKDLFIRSFNISQVKIESP